MIRPAWLVLALAVSVPGGCTTCSVTRNAALEVAEAWSRDPSAGGLEIGKQLLFLPLWYLGSLPLDGFTLPLQAAWLLYDPTDYWEALTGRRHLGGGGCGWGRR